MDEASEEARGPGWSEAATLVRLSGDRWTVRDACEGVMVFGGTGSGKTSGSGQNLALSYLSAGFGGLVLCAKKEEAQQWRAYAKDTGRGADVMAFGSDPSLAFNFMEYEARRPGEGAGLTENLVNLFLEVTSIGSGPGGSRTGDPFWERSMKSLVRNAVDLILMAGSSPSLPAIFEVIQSAADSPSQTADPIWRQRSRCWQLLGLAETRLTGTPSEPDLRQVAGYWMRHFPGMGEKTRGSIVAMFLSVAESLMRGRMRELFCGRSTLEPVAALQGKLIIIDLPVKEWSEVGRFAAVLWKYCLQKAIERRGDNATRAGRPVFIWADECHHFVSRYDQLFQTTARSSRAATVYLTQNYPNLVAALGADASGKAIVDSLLGNLGTKIFHANSDPETNRYAAELIGRCLQGMRSRGSGSSVSGGGAFSLQGSSNAGISEHFEYAVQPSEFSTLRRGGAENALRTEAFVVQSGRLWTHTQSPWTKVAFRQWGPHTLERAAELTPQQAPGRRR